MDPELELLLLERERRRRAGTPDRGVVSNLGRSLALGAAETVPSILGSVTWVGEQAGRLPGLSPLRRISERGSEGIRKMGQELEELAEPQGTVGKVGRFVGRAAGEVLTAAAAAPKLTALGARVLQATAPRATLAAQRAISTLGPRAAGAARVAAADLPISALQAAAAMGEESVSPITGREGGLLLPGYLGALAEQTAFSGAAGALMGRRVAPRGGVDMGVQYGPTRPDIEEVVPPVRPSVEEAVPPSPIEAAKEFAEAAVEPGVARRELFEGRIGRLPPSQLDIALERAEIGAQTRRQAEREAAERATQNIEQLSGQREARGAARAARGERRIESAAERLRRQSAPAQLEESLEYIRREVPEPVIQPAGMRGTGGAVVGDPRVREFLDRSKNYRRMFTGQVDVQDVAATRRIATAAGREAPTPELIVPPTAPTPELVLPEARVRPGERVPLREAPEAAYERMLPARAGREFAPETGAPQGPLRIGEEVLPEGEFGFPMRPPAPTGSILDPRAGVISRELLEALGGGAVGATVGGAVGGEEGAIAGGVAGAVGVPMAGRAMRARAVPPATLNETVDAIRPSATAAGASEDQVQKIAQKVMELEGKGVPASYQSPYERDLARNRIGVPKDEPLFNPSLRTIDPTGGRLAKIEEERLVAQGVARERVSDAVVREMADKLGIDELMRSRKINLDTVELMALGNRIAEDRSFIARMEEMAQAATNPEVKAAIDEAIGAAYTRLLNYDRRMLKAGSETGRQLRILREMGRESGSIRGYVNAAKRYLGVSELNANAEDAILAIFNKRGDLAAKEAEFTKYVQSLQKSTKLELLTDNARWGLLSTIASFMRNFVGGVEATVGAIVDAPIAAAMDRVFSGKSLDRTIAFGVGETKAGLRGMMKGIRDLKDFKTRFMGGVDLENPLDTLNRRRINYESAIGAGEETWRKMLRPAARLLQMGSDAVYGTLAATDNIFFTGALQASLTERAALRAMRENLKPGTREFAAAVNKYLDPDNMRPVDVIMAEMEALDATLKTTTWIQEALRDVRRRKRPGVSAFLDFTIPFPNTPTNIVRKAFERVPLIGSVVGEKTQLANIRNRLTSLRDIGIEISDREIANELRRYRIQGASKQITGAGMVMVGYALHKNGLLTTQFSSPIGRSGSEREEARERQLTGAGPLAIVLGDKSYSLGGAFALSAPLLAIGAAMSAADDYDEGTPLSSKVGAGMKSFGRTLLEVPVLRAASDIERMISGQSDFAALSANQATRLIPASSLVRATARAMDTESGGREAEGFRESLMMNLPGLRQRLAPSVTPLGEVLPSTGPADIMLNPATSRRITSGPLYEGLRATRFSPGPARRLEGETARQYSERRQMEGVSERALLQGLMSGQQGAWDFVSDTAYERFMENGDWSQLLASVLQKQRTAVTEQRRLQNQ